MAFSLAARFVCLAALFYFASARYTLNNDDLQIDGITIEDKIDGSPKVEEDLTWPGFAHLGQVSAVSVDGDGNIHIFHRGDRIWDAQTFDRAHRLRDPLQGTIKNDTVIVIDPNTGKVLYSWGHDMFYMPHALTVDRSGNSWITDVGLHQVFKFPARESKPAMIIGEALVPGSDTIHLCKPTDVAVSASGDFFVSDGYCNSRILMFSKRGQLMKEFGSKDGMRIPHSLTLVAEHDAVCVADRENGRILCYATGTDGTTPGTPLASIEGQGLGRVFAVDTRGTQLFVVNGPDIWTSSQSVSSDHGLVFDVESGTPLTLWGPEKGFQLPHDLAVSPDGKSVYVTELDLSAPKRVYKFNIYD